MDTTTKNEKIIFVCDTIIPAPVEKVEWDTPEEMIAAHNAVKDSAVKKLKDIGLTEEEAKAIVGV